MKKQTMGDKRTFEFLSVFSGLGGDFLCVEINGYNKNQNIYMTLDIGGFMEIFDKTIRGDYFRDYVHKTINSKGKYLETEIQKDDITMIMVHKKGKFEEWHCWD